MVSISIKKLLLLGVDKLLVVTGTADGCPFVDVSIKIPDADEAIPCGRAYCDASEEDAFNTAPEEGHRLWVARIDLSLHDDLRWFVGQMRKDSGDASLKVQVEDPETGSKCNWTYKKLDASYQKEFDVGVLLVHGIGGAKRGETIVRFAEPTVKFMQDWLDAASERSAKQVDDAADAQKWQEEFRRAAPDAAARLWGISKKVNKFAEDAKIATAAYFYIDDTVLAPAPTEPELPASTLINFSTFGPDKRYRDTFILMAESCWTNTVVAPTLEELSDWTLRVIPTMFGTYLGMPARRARRHRGKVSTAFLWNILWTWLVLVPVGLTVCGLLQIVFLGLLIASLPIPRLYSIVAPFIQWLMGTTALSYVYVRSPIRAAAIRGQVIEDLDWLRARCRKIVILAHSQGAAVINEALGNRPCPDEVKQLITFGSGLKKLEFLREDKVDPKYQYLTLGWFGLIIAAVIASPLGRDVWAPVFLVLIACLFIIMGIATVERTALDTGNLVLGAADRSLWVD